MQTVSHNILKHRIILLFIILSFPTFGQSDSILISNLKIAKGESGKIGGWLISPNFTGRFYDWQPDPAYKITGGQFTISNGQIKKGALIGHWSSQYPSGEIFEEADYDTTLTKFNRQTKQSQDLYLPEEYKIEYRSRLTYYKRYYKNGSTLQQLSSPKEKVVSSVFYFINGDSAEYRYNDWNTGNQIIKSFNPDKTTRFISEIKCDNIKCIQTDIDYKKREKTEITTWSKDAQKREIIVHDLNGNLISSTKFTKEKYEQTLFDIDKSKVITISNYKTHWTTISTYNGQGKLVSSKKRKDP